MERRKFIALGSAAVVWLLSQASLAADYKPEFKMSVIVTEDTAWGRAATRFADAVRLRTDDVSKSRIISRGGFSQVSKRPSSSSCNRERQILL